mmetsp:Transcript_9411/g.38098  ORF Transcript_9411/g.38098 Transcript_9411/m.38098 type:complete len:375 (+) Transcript_9411:352-1476(+)
MDVLGRDREVLHVAVVVQDDERRVLLVVVPVHVPRVVHVRVRRREAHRHLNVFPRGQRDGLRLGVVGGNTGAGHRVTAAERELGHRRFDLHDRERRDEFHPERRGSLRAGVGQGDRSEVRRVRDVSMRVAGPVERIVLVSLEPGVVGVRGESDDERLHGLGRLRAARRDGAADAHADRFRFGVCHRGFHLVLVAVNSPDPQLRLGASQLQRQRVRRLDSLVVRDALRAHHGPDETLGPGPAVPVLHLEPDAAAALGNRHQPRLVLELERSHALAHPPLADDVHADATADLVQVQRRERGGNVGILWIFRIRVEPRLEFDHHVLGAVVDAEEPLGRTGSADAHGTPIQAREPLRTLRAVSVVTHRGVLDGLDHQG